MGAGAVACHRHATGGNGNEKHRGVGINSLLSPLDEFTYDFITAGSVLDWFCYCSPVETEGIRPPFHAEDN